ncbi:hypothetical protein QFC24_006273 [Naganishia onofrii]|uniref:Uncharacterized protein n=1 Tax=Naganishia onofrii TaxID=1851511 RepID=A0ACC2X6R3_9TREE|nr:hypothetical protein QFC24_006273 [Naganishia onofrii]
MQDVLKKRPAFSPLDLFDSGGSEEDTDLDAIASREFDDIEDDTMVERQKSDKDNIPTVSGQLQEKQPRVPATQSAIEPAVEPVTQPAPEPATQPATRPPAPTNAEGRQLASDANPTDSSVNKNSARHRRYLDTPSSRGKLVTSAMAELVRLQRDRDAETQAAQSQQERLDESWLELERMKAKREERLAEMQRERFRLEVQDRQREWMRRDQEEERRKLLDRWTEEDRAAKRRAEEMLEYRDRQEELRRAKRFEQEMDEKKVRLWISLRSATSDDEAGKVVWGEDWPEQRRRFPIRPMSNGVNTVL